MESGEIVELFYEEDLSLLIGVVFLLGAIVVDQATRAFRRTTAKHSSRIAQCGLSGRDVAERLLGACGLTATTVERGARVDVYHPWRNQIRLTDTTYQTPSVVSLATAAHEVGHAQQFAERILAARLWRIAMPLSAGLPIVIVAGVMLSLFGVVDVPLLSSATAIPVLFVFLVLLQLPVHLPMERDASRRARELVQRAGLIEAEELPAFDEIIQAAWKTHLAAHLQRWIAAIAVVGLLAFAPSLFTLDGSGEMLPESIEPVPVAAPEGVDGPLPDAAPDAYVLPNDDYINLLPSFILLPLSVLPIVLLLFLLAKVEKLQKQAPTVEEQAVQHNNAGNGLQAEGKLEEAEAEFTRAIEANPNLTIAWQNRGQLYASLGRLSEARADLDEVLRQAPQLADARALRGYVRALQNDLDGGLDDCNQAVQLRPDGDGPLGCRGLVHQARGDYSLAIDDFTAALAIDGQRSDLYRDRGLAWFRQGDNEQALADADRALEMDNDDVIAINNRAAARIRLAEYERAMADLARAIRLQPDMPSPYKHLAWIRATCPDEALRDGEAAVRHATQALDLIGWNQSDWLETLAAAYAEAGDFDQAIQWQQKLIEEVPAEDVSEQQQRLDLYRRGLPYRDAPEWHSTPATL